MPLVLVQPSRSSFHSSMRTYDGGRSDDVDEDGDGDDRGGVPVGVLGPQNTLGGVELCCRSGSLGPHTPSSLMSTDSGV